MVEDVRRRFDDNLQRFIVDVVRKAEAKEGDRYKASFAGGKSGLSFGAFQNDVAANGHARETFREILTESGLFSEEEVKTIVGEARTEGVKREDLAPFLGRINQVLNSEAGRREIDKRDEQQKETLLGRMRKFLAAVWDKRNPHGAGVFEPTHEDFPKAVATVAAWINRTGAPTKIIDFVKGKKVVSEWEKDGKKVRTERQIPPTGSVTLKDLVDPDTGYFSGRPQFSKAGNGENFEMWFKRITENLSKLGLPETTDGNGGDAPEAATDAAAPVGSPTIEIPDAAGMAISAVTDGPLGGASVMEDNATAQPDARARDRRAEADRLIASDDYYANGEKQARVAAIFKDLYPPAAEPEPAPATPTGDPFEVDAAGVDSVPFDSGFTAEPMAPDTPEDQDALQAEANALIASADYWRDPHKQRRVAAIFKRLYPGQVRTAPLDFGEGI